MRFAWQGFQLTHPDDWAPAALTGDRREGYVRLASAGSESIQIRWQTAKNAPSRKALSVYLQKLAQDSRKAVGDFTSEVEELPTGYSYRYGGAIAGRGLLFRNEACGRNFFIEALGKKSDRLSMRLKETVESFTSSDSDQERWAILGLDLLLPAGLEVRRRELLAGRTVLMLDAKGCRITAERWGLADLLIAKHGLIPWASGLLRIPATRFQEAEHGLLAQSKPLPWLHDHTLVTLDQANNQLIVVRSRFRSGKWKPTWDWIASCSSYPAEG